jgi:hypothetical protein
VMFDATDSFVIVCQKLDKLRFAGTVNWEVLGKNILRSLKLTQEKNCKTLLRGS